jgi:Spy/CpxP family protein refolding chaperone
MKASVFGCAVAALLALVLSGSVDAQSFAWWKSEQFQKDLALTADQSTRIDEVFQTTLPKLRQQKEELDRQETELSKLIAADSDELQVAKQIDRVEAARSQLNKMRTLMLLHMRQLLTPDQRTRFNTLHEQWEKEHRKPQDHR